MERIQKVWDEIKNKYNEVIKLDDEGTKLNKDGVVNKDLKLAMDGIILMRKSKKLKFII